MLVVLRLMLRSISERTHFSFVTSIQNSDVPFSIKQRILKKEKDKEQDQQRFKFQLGSIRSELGQGSRAWLYKVATRSRASQQKVVPIFMLKRGRLLRLLFGVRKDQAKMQHQIFRRSQTVTKMIRTRVIMKDRPLRSRQRLTRTSSLKY